MIGQLSSDSGIALFVPGYFISAGILLYAAITAAVMGLQRGRERLYLTFAATCLFSAALTACFAAYYLADSVAGALAAMRWQAVAATLLVVAILAFVAVYTNARGIRRWIVAACVLAAAHIAVIFTLPLGTRFSRIDSFGWVHLPWGESLFYLNGVPSAWNAGFRILIVAVMVWAVRRLVLQYRSGAQREAGYLAAYLVVLFAASMQGALIDMGLAPSAHAIGFAFVGLALIMSVNLQSRLNEHTLALEQTAAQLRAENERRREAETEIRSRAFRDPLTGLPNRLFAQERIASLIDLGRTDTHGAVLICDLDHFKVVNDALSHEVGDAILREVAARLTATAKGHAIVARTEGDAFMAILEGLHADPEVARGRIEGIADDFASALAQPLQLGERSLSLSGSIGYATFAAMGSANEVIMRAEMALQLAKRRGRNIIQAFVPAMQNAATERYRVLEGMREAIGGPDLALHFQPLVDRDGRVVGAEALMRWNSPRGPVPPSTFIPIAEETGLIHALGEWSLAQGCECLARWKREHAGFDGHLSVNVSPWQLARPEFVGRLHEIVTGSGIDPGTLTLEITESAVLFDVQETVAKLREIRPLGVRIALDDFGTGYSSLALIKDLPLDAIKIDQSFVRHLREGANRHLIRVIVAIGSELGIDIIAEGVETQADRDALVALGCTLLQGYFLARPMPEAQLVEWLRARAPAAPRAKTLGL